jgi:transposase
MCSRQIRSVRKKKEVIEQTVRRLPRRHVLLIEDETDLLLFPPLRSMWARRGEPARVLLNGWNAHRVVFGCMNLATGHRLFLVHHKQRAADFQAFLRQVRRQYRGWKVTLLLDNHPIHTAGASTALAQQLGMTFLWLPKRSPELNPMDTLWGKGKTLICANKQYTSIDDQAQRFIEHLQGLRNRLALRMSGILSNHFWLRQAMSKHFRAHA